MNTKTPIFTLHEPQHFSDYGFDSQLDYFQVLEEARKHKRDTCTSRSMIDNLHFKLQKPISKDHDNSKKIKKSRKRWWKNALHFFKRKRSSSSDSNYDQQYCVFSGPVYLTESRSGSSTPNNININNYNRMSTSRPSSGPLAGTITPLGKGDLDIPYVSLTEVNVDERYKISASPMPIYLVT